MYDKSILPDMTGARSDSSISLVWFDSAREMEILRSVVLRDALVSLLTEECRKFMVSGDLCLTTVVQALLEVREASLLVIEAVMRWRCTLVKREVFNVRGINYVATMATDMGFVENGLVTLKEDFGVEFGTANPFALPCATSSSAVETYDSSEVDAPDRRTKLELPRAKISRSKMARRTPKSTCSFTSTPASARKVGARHDNNGSAEKATGVKYPPKERLSQDRSSDLKIDGEGKDNLLPLLVMLNDIDSEQCERLTKAHSFLEAEVTRKNYKEQEATWWGFHRWKKRPWCPLVYRMH